MKFEHKHGVAGLRADAVALLDPDHPTSSGRRQAGRRRHHEDCVAGLDQPVRDQDDAHVPSVADACDDGPDSP